MEPRAACGGSRVGTNWVARTKAAAAAGRSFRLAAAIPCCMAVEAAARSAGFGLIWACETAMAVSMRHAARLIAEPELGECAMGRSLMGHVGWRD